MIEINLDFLIKGQIQLEVLFCIKEERAQQICDEIEAIKTIALQEDWTMSEFMKKVMNIAETPNEQLLCAYQIGYVHGQ